jgi:hypothetical protein
MSVIFMEDTVKLLNEQEAHIKIKSGVIKQTEGGVKYLKINEV